MAQVRAQLSDAPDSEAAPMVARLDRARTALGAERPLLALYLMEAPWKAGRSFRGSNRPWKPPRASAFVKASRGVPSSELFAKKWTSLGEPRPQSAGGA